MLDWIVTRKICDTSVSKSMFIRSTCNKSMINESTIALYTTGAVARSQEEHVAEEYFKSTVS